MEPPTNKSITATWWQHTKIVGKSTMENSSASLRQLADLDSLKLECHIRGKSNTGLDRRVKTNLCFSVLLSVMMVRPRFNLPCSTFEASSGFWSFLPNRGKWP